MVFTRLGGRAKLARRAALSGTLADPDWVSAVGHVGYDAQQDLRSDVISDFTTGDL